MGKDFQPITIVPADPIDKVTNAFATISGERIIKVFDMSGGGAPIIDDGEGAPFKKLSYASSLKSLTKGGKNKIIIKPRVLIENAIDDTNVIATLGSGGITDVGQIFRLTGGIFDIDRFHLTLEAIAGAALLAIENFESYADTTALRAVWVSNDLTNTPPTLETTLFQEGTKAMKVSTTSSVKSKNDEIKKTYGSNQDWSTYNGIQFQFRNDGTYNVEVRIEDASANISKHTISLSGVGSYQFIQLAFTNFLPVTATPADLSTIKKISFFLATASTVPFYVDIIELYSTGSFGTELVELYDFGVTSNPTALGMPVTSASINLESGKKVYEIALSKNGLTPNNYLGIVLTAPSVAIVKVYGKNGSNLYASGFSFKSIDNSTITTTGNGNDLYFAVFAVDKAIFNGIRFVAN